MAHPFDPNTLRRIPQTRIDQPLKGPRLAPSHNDIILEGLPATPELLTVAVNDPRALHLAILARYPKAEDHHMLVEQQIAERRERARDAIAKVLERPGGEPYEIGRAHRLNSSHL